MTDLIPSRKKRGRLRRTEERIEPTPETLAKLQGDQLGDLLKQGALTPDQERVALRIHSFSLALKRGMFPQSRIQAAAPLPARTPPEAPLERLKERDVEHWSKVYGPWATAMSRLLVVRRPRLTALSLVERIVNENSSPEKLSVDFSLPRERVIKSLQKALDGYIAQKREKNIL